LLSLFNAHAIYLSLKGETISNSEKLTIYKSKIALLFEISKSNKVLDQ